MAGVVQTGSDGPIALVAPASSITPAFDAPPQPHDLLVAWVYASGAAGTLSTPPGWTKIGEANGGLHPAPPPPSSPPHAPRPAPAPPLPPPPRAGPAGPRGAGWTNSGNSPTWAKSHCGGAVLRNPPVGAPLSELVTVSSALGVGFALILAVFQPPAGGGLGSGESYVYYDGMTLAVKRWGS